MTKLKKKEKGFTIIECIVAFAIFVEVFASVTVASKAYNRSLNIALETTRCRYEAFGVVERYKYCTDAELRSVMNNLSEFNMTVTLGSSVTVSEGDTSATSLFYRYH